MTKTQTEPAILRENFRPWNAGCGPVLLLRVKFGPGAGTVGASCSCEWRREFMSMKAARRAADKHEEANR